MPLLQLVLDKDIYDKKFTVKLTGGLSKQPLTLKYFQIYFGITGVAETDAELIDKFPTGFIYVQLPFLNSYDVNTNAPIENSIALPLGYETPIDKSTADFKIFVKEKSGMMDILFNPAKNIDSQFGNFEIYNANGGKITGLSYTVILMFEYRRPDLI
jgi:hypothetical protein